MCTLVEQIREALPKNSIGRYDLLSIYKNPVLFQAVVEYLCAEVNYPVEYVVSPEATGWPLAGAMANHLRCGFIGVRKEGKLPYAKTELLQETFVDYTGKTKTLAITKEALPLKSKVVLVDDWIETGAQMQAVMRLLQNRQAEVEKILCIGADTKNEPIRSWAQQGFLCCIGQNM